MADYQQIAKGMETADHAADPAQIAVPPGGVTGPGLPAPKVAPTEDGVLGHLGQTLGDFGSGLMQEGLGGILDVHGMMDRQEAQRELRGNFDIVDPANPPAHAAPNQVSEEEFEKTARLYSDVRLDRTHLHFDLADGASPVTGAKDQDQYKRDFMGNVGRILQTPDGRTLIDGVAHNANGKDVEIQNVAKASQSSCEYDKSQAAEEGAANGKGTDTTLRIKPGSDDTVGEATDPWHKERSDVQLFHEMTHAFHQTNGTEDHTGAAGKGLNGSTRDIDNYNGADDASIGWEQQAVGIGNHEGDKTPNENRYRAERAQIGASGSGVVPGDVGMPLRGDYS